LDVDASRWKLLASILLTHAMTPILYDREPSSCCIGVEDLQKEILLQVWLVMYGNLWADSVLASYCGAQGSCRSDRLALAWRMGRQG
jgi:hypothetical protein